MATAKQKIFINEYLKTWNATASARVAGYANPNVSGPRLLVNDSIKEIIQERLDALKMDADRAVLQLSQIANGADLTRYAEQIPVYGTDRSGEQYLRGFTVKFDFDALDRDGLSHLIKGIKQNSQGGLDVEFLDRLSALDKIAKIHGLYQQRLDVTTAGDSLNESIIAALNTVWGEEDEENVNNE